MTMGENFHEHLTESTVNAVLTFSVSRSARAKAWKALPKEMYVNTNWVSA